MNEISGFSATGAIDRATMQYANQDGLPTGMDQIKGRSDAKIRETCEEFESIFVEMMIKAARATLKPEEGMMYGGNAEKIFSGMLDTEYSKTMSSVQNMGIARMLYEQLTGNTWEE